MSLHDAVAKYVENGDVLATGGFTTNRKPYAAVSEILRQGQKDFIVYAGPGGGEVDMLIGEGRVAAYINCYTANSGYTNVSRRFRAAIEKGQLTYEDYSQDVLMLMLHASSLGLPFLPVRLMQGSGLMKYWGISEEKRKTMPKMEDLKCVEIENPMVPGQKVVAVPVPRIDTALIHVQQASPDGTCIICGDEFHDIDIAVAARKTIVTCEEIVSNEYIRRDPTKTRIFGECVQAVVKAPYGAWPAQCYDYYDDDDAALKEYDKASKYQDKADAVEQLAKAAAKADRDAKEGVIRTVVAPCGCCGIILELNCETDFCAKGDKFQGLVNDVAKALADSKASTLEEALQVSMPEGTTEEYIKAMCSSIGENMGLRKFARLTVDGNGTIASYIHMGGKVGVLLSVKAGKEETVKSDAFKALVKDLTLHIAAAAPKSVSSDSLDPAFVAEEQEIARQQLIQEGKPEHLLEKILPGKLKALYAQSCLLNQGFVKDPSDSVDALLKQVGKELGDEISVVSFVRYQLGA